VIGPRSQCSTCVRYTPPLLSGGDKPVCAAFPEGIPDGVFAGVVDHREPVDGDHGIRWESNGQPHPGVNRIPDPGGSGGRVQAASGDPHAALLQQQWEQARADLLNQWPATAQPMVDELAGQAEAAAQAGDVSALGGLAASAGVISALATPLAESGSKLAKQAAAGVVAEAADAKVTITAPADAGAERVRQTADAVAQIIARGYASGAARASLQLAGAEPAEVKAEVARQLGELGQSQNGLVGDNVGALLSAAQHAGRLAMLEEHPAKGYMAVEVNDQHRCEPCSAESSKQFRTLREALKDYPFSGFRSCLGHWRCRGFIRPQW
jgi:hypothetical protein